MQCVPHAAILPIFYCLAWFDTVEFNLLPCPNDKKYDDVVFVDRVRYQLAMFGNRLLIGLSRFLHAHIGYEIDTAKIIAAFCRIFYCLYDLIRLISIACRVQTTRFTMMQFSLVDSVINWLCLESIIDRVISNPSCSCCAWNWIMAAYCRISYCLYYLIRLNSIACHVQSSWFTMIWFSLIDSDINLLCLNFVYWQGYLDSLIFILHLK